MRKTLISNKIKNLIANDTKIISFCLIVILISSMSTASADNIVINSNNQKQIRFDDFALIKTEMHHTNNFQVSLTENMGLSENAPQKNDQAEQGSAIHAYSVSLSEKITLTENQDARFVVIIFPHTLNLQTTMDKISNSERIRFNGKTIVVDNIPFYGMTAITLSQLETNFVQHTENNPMQLLEKIFYTNIISNISSEYNDINTVSQIIQPIENDVVWIDHTTDPKNPTILLLLVPLSGYLLFRKREEKFQFFKSKQVLSFYSIAVLVKSNTVRIFFIALLLVNLSFFNNQAFADSVSQGTPACGTNDPFVSGNEGTCTFLGNTDNNITNLDDQVAIQSTLFRTQSDSLDITDSITTITNRQSALSESIPLDDQVATSTEHPTTPLTESLQMDDQVTVDATDSTRTLDESIPLDDQVTVDATH
ncbi:MAG: hypothetical protein HYR87_05500 [Thaumarchaeota archaeon]|nr:hypothetical protein [Nitrososphaerota archaeon]